MSTPAAATDASAASFHLLGPITVTVAGQPVRLGGPRQVAVLARLLLTPGQVVGMDQLADSVWEDDWPTRPEVTIRSYISNLRRSIEPDRRAGDRHSVIERVADGYRLAVDPARIDANRFEQLVKAGRQSLADQDPVAALRQLDDARSLWRGEPCQGLLDADAVVAFRSRLAELALIASELSFEARLALGQHETVLPDLEAALSAHPLRERLTELTMLALYRAGRQSDALAACQQLRRRLVDGLGVDPGPSIRDLEHRILIHDESLQGTPRRSTRSAPSESAPPLVGRTRELERMNAVDDALRQGRGAAVLLTGDAGVGKSALASLLADRVARSGTEVRWGRCLALAQSQVLWPWRQVLADLDATRSFGDAASATAAFPAMADLLLARSRNQPLLIVLEDLHWADEATVELLAFLGAALAEHPVAFAVTWRPGDVSAASTRAALRDLSRLPAVARIDVTGLEPADLVELIDLVGIETPCRTELAEALVTVAGGNPFLIRELVDAVHEAVAAGARNGEPVLLEGTVADLADLLLSLPPSPSLIDMVLARVERIETAVPEILTAGALVAGSFRAELVATALGVPVESVEQTLDAALDAGLLCDGGTDPGSYRFAQPITARSIEASTPGPRLARLHAAIGHARWMEGADPAALAHHFSRARSTGTSLLAARFALESVRQIGTMARMSQAEAVASEAVEALDPIAGAARLNVELALVAAQSARLGGDGTRRRQMGERALVAARRLDDGDVEAMTALAATGPDPAGPGLATLAWAEAPLDHDWALETLSGVADRLGPAHVWTPVLELRRARLDGHTRSWPHPRHHHVDGDRQPDQVAVVAGAYWREWLLVTAAPRPGLPWDAVRELVDPDTPLAPAAAAVTGHDRLLAYRLALSDLARWPEAARPGELLARIIDEATEGVPDGAVPGSVMDLDRVVTVATVAMVQGRIDQAAHLVETVLPQCRGAGVATATSIEVQRLALRWEQGRFSELATLARSGPEPWQALAAAELGDRPAARRLLDRLQTDHAPPWQWCLIAAAAHRCGHRRAARRAFEHLGPWTDAVATAHHGLVVLGPTAYFAALAAITAGAPAGADHLLHQADLLARRVEAPGWLIRILAARAEAAAADHEWSLAEQFLGEAKALAADAGVGWLDGWLTHSGGLQPTLNRFPTA